MLALGKQQFWVPTIDIKIIATKSSSSVIKRIQYPLMLAQRCTVHKVRGLRLEKTVVSY